MNRIARILLAVPLAAHLFAGGFWVELGNPSASPEAREKHAVLVARVTGCHDVTKASVTATAEGIVGGQHKSVALTLIPLATPGAYAVTREWSAAGNWAVTVVATANGLTTSLLVRMDRDGFARSSARYFPRSPRPEEIAAVIGNTASL